MTTVTYNLGDKAEDPENLTKSSLTSEHDLFSRQPPTVSGDDYILHGSGGLRSFQSDRLVTVRTVLPSTGDFCLSLTCQNAFATSYRSERKASEEIGEEPQAKRTTFSNSLVDKSLSLGKGDLDPWADTHLSVRMYQATVSGFPGHFV